MLIENYLDCFFMFYTPTSNNVFFLATTLIYIKKEEVKFIKFEPCYRLVYNWCNCHNVHEIKKMRNKIINYILDHSIIVPNKNIQMLQGVFGYFRNFEPYWYSLLIDSNIRVKIKKQKMMKIFELIIIQNNIPKDLSNLIKLYF